MATPLQEACGELRRAATSGSTLGLPAVGHASWKKLDVCSVNIDCSHSPSDENCGADDDCLLPRDNDCGAYERLYRLTRMLGRDDFTGAESPSFALPFVNAAPSACPRRRAFAGSARSW